MDSSLIHKSSLHTNTFWIEIFMILHFLSTVESQGTIIFTSQDATMMNVQVNIPVTGIDVKGGWEIVMTFSDPVIDITALSFAEIVDQSADNKVYLIKNVAYNGDIWSDVTYSFNAKKSGWTTASADPPGSACFVGHHSGCSFGAAAPPPAAQTTTAAGGGGAQTTTSSTTSSTTTPAPAANPQNPAGGTTTQGESAGGATTQGETAGDATTPGDSAGGASTTQGESAGGATTTEGDSAGGATTTEGDSAGDATTPVDSAGTTTVTASEGAATTVGNAVGAATTQGSSGSESTTAASGIFGSPGSSGSSGSLGTSGSGTSVNLTALTTLISHPVIQDSEEVCQNPTNSVFKSILADSDVGTCETVHRNDFSTKIYRAMGTPLSGAVPIYKAVKVTGTDLRCKSVSAFVPGDCSLSSMFNCPLKETHGTTECLFECVGIVSKFAYIGFNNQKVTSQVCEIVLYS